MFDIEIPAPDGAASIVAIGKTLGEAGVSLEGGGVWAGVAHYLVEDADAATHALVEAGLGSPIVSPVVVAELDADVPGSLGRMMQRLIDAGVTLYVQYSDHNNRKVLVVDNAIRASEVLEVV